jgi:hypothetical protein
MRNYYEGHTRAKGSGMESVKSQIVIFFIKRGLYVWLRNKYKWGELKEKQVVILVRHNVVHYDFYIVHKGKLAIQDMTF